MNAYPKRIDRNGNGRCCWNSSRLPYSAARQGGSPICSIAGRAESQDICLLSPWPRTAHSRPELQGNCPAVLTRGLRRVRPPGGCPGPEAGSPPLYCWCFQVLVQCQPHRAKYARRAEITRITVLAVAIHYATGINALINVQAADQLSAVSCGDGQKDMRQHSVQLSFHFFYRGRIISERGGM